MSHHTHNQLHAIYDRLADVQVYEPFYTFIATYHGRAQALCRQIQSDRPVIWDMASQELIAAVTELQQQLGAGSPLGDGWPDLIKRIERLLHRCAHNTHADVIHALDHNMALLKNDLDMTERVYHSISAQLQQVIEALQDQQAQQDALMIQLTTGGEALPNHAHQDLAPYLLKGQIYQPVLLLVRCLHACQGASATSQLLQDIAQQQVEQHIKALHGLWLQHRSQPGNPGLRHDQQAFQQAVLLLPTRGPAARALGAQKNLIQQLELAWKNTLGTWQWLDPSHRGELLPTPESLDRLIQDQELCQLALEQGQINADIRDKWYRLQQQQIQLKQEKKRLQQQRPVCEKQILDRKKSWLFLQDERKTLQAMQAASQWLQQKFIQLQKNHQDFYELQVMIQRLQLKTSPHQGHQQTSTTLSPQQKQLLQHVLQDFAKKKQAVVEQYRSSHTHTLSQASYFETQQIYQAKLAQQEQALRQVHQDSMALLQQQGVCWEQWLADYGDLNKAPLSMD